MADKSILDIQLACRASDDRDRSLRHDIPKIVESILESYNAPDSKAHLDSSPMPSEPTIIDVLHLLQYVIFPGYHGRNQIERTNLVYFIGELTIQVYELLSVQIARALKNDCSSALPSCLDCEEQGRELTISFLSRIAQIRQMLSKDVAAAYDGDPAAKNHDEIIFCYPGLTAIMIYRIAHELHLLKIPVIPRIMTEYAHHRTGIDIHPGAQIGTHFFVDHCTGTVVGETAILGNHVKMYQGVGLVAKSLAAGQALRGQKRHPTIEDHVVIGAGAKVLGAITIGAHSRIGANAVVVKPSPPNSVIIGVPGQIVLVQARKRPVLGPFSTSQVISRLTSSGVPKGRVVVTETPAMISRSSPSFVFMRQMRS